MSARDEESSDQAMPMAPFPTTTQDQPQNNNLSKGPPNKPSKLLTLPAELKNDIYRMVLFPTDNDPPQPTTPHWTPSAYISTCPHEYITPNLLQICQPTRREASAIHYLENKFAMCYCKGDLFEYVMERRGEVVEWEGLNLEREEMESGPLRPAIRSDELGRGFLREVELGRKSRWELTDMEKYEGAEKMVRVLKPPYPSMSSMSFIVAPPRRAD
ncbi:hypothetical protein M409DRAFT_16165 [Zasmidium cellare ATCC 36951]|uniref:Uncharacterized protein n=1 Tax=Zasmidium cellare ATCC 36951 TaxID=1080233 RepID=A0A6A6D8C6_ZASCE|nr:uncharacterized protein M409DRAFT_16165 [Zasmidium cellare ATCC 36951]KAF2173896.1 hypothetical protein M409DRAFT_16165 [Zasmidium cellare ATCC 36951]